MSPLNRRLFLQRTMAAAALASAHHPLAADTADLKLFEAEIAKRHDEAVQRLQNWIRQPAIAAENRGMNEGCDLMMRMLRDAGFDKVTKVPTERPSRSLRHARCRRAENDRHLLHVRREAGRPLRVVVSAV